jgi:hypothetical protein
VRGYILGANFVRTGLGGGGGGREIDRKSGLLLNRHFAEIKLWPTLRA